MAALHLAWGEVFGVPATTSAADLLRLPADGNKHELYEGVLVREMTAPGHGEICQRLGGELCVYAKATGLPNRIVEVWNAPGTTALLDTQSLTSALLPGCAIDVRALLDG